MSKEVKTTIDFCAIEKMKQLSVADNRDATPPPARIRSRFHSFSSLKDTQSPTEESSPSPRVCNSMPTFSHKHHTARHHELTPVMRNISYVDDCTHPSMVSPDEGNICDETLVIPDPIQSSTGQALKIKTLPSLPSIAFGDRTKSLENLSSLIKKDYDEEDGVEQTVPIPSRERFYSFNSRHQYTKQMKGSVDNPNNGSLIPYQPSRHDLTDVGAVDTEELSRIFIQKDTSPNPIGERQFSIPSIRMANHLVGGSITTFETEEDDLKDDASWSSRGSSLYLPDDPSSDPFYIQSLKFTSSKQQPVVIVEGAEVLSDDPQQLMGNNNDTSVNAVRGRKRKSKPEDLAVYEWLRMVERDSAIAEAASSKFLTRQRRDFARQHSSSSDIY